MSSVLLVGLGTVGVRAARQVVDTPGVERLLVADRDVHRAQRVAKALGARASALAWSLGEALPDDLDAVACALPDGVDADVAAAALDAGVPVASVGDEHDAIERLRDLDERARALGVTVVAGCGLAPGLADVLAAHAASAFDVVDEIRVARAGWAGPCSVATLRRELRGPAFDRHGGEWRTGHDRDEELVWFPEPIGGRDCRAVHLGLDLLVDAFDDVPDVSYHAAEPDRRVRFHRFRRRGDEGEWGAVRVEVWGRRGSVRDVVVYGVVERTAVAAGAMLAVVAGHLAGAYGAPAVRPGVAGVAGLAEPVVLLDELADRGVKGATFEGAPAGV